MSLWPQAGACGNKHILRGPTEFSAKERRVAEYSASLAGMRHPADVLAKWKSLEAALVDVRGCLQKFREQNPQWRNLRECCGPTSQAREPPAQEALAPLRQ